MIPSNIARDWAREASALWSAWSVEQPTWALIVMIAAALLGFALLWRAAGTLGAALMGALRNGRVAKIAKGRRGALRLLVTHEVDPALGRFLAATIRTEISPFLLDGPHDVVVACRRDLGLDPRDADLGALAIRTDVDAIIHIARDKRKALKAIIAASPKAAAIPERQNAKQVAIRLTRHKVPKAVGAALAYLAAREMRPVLSTPRAFKPDRIEAMLARVELMRAGLGEAIDRPGLGLIDRDIGAAALCLGELTQNTEHLRRAESALTAALAEMPRTDNLLAWANASRDLGLAIVALADLGVRPAKRQMGLDHIRAAVDALRGLPETQSAELAARALVRAEGVKPETTRAANGGGRIF